MTDPRMERLERHLIRLKLVSTKARLDTLLEEGARSELSFLDFLDKVIGDEVAAKDASHSRADSSTRTRGDPPTSDATRRALAKRHTSRASMSATPTFTKASRNG